MEVANTLAYYKMANVTAMKFFIVQTSGLTQASQYLMGENLKVVWAELVRLKIFVQLGFSMKLTHLCPVQY